MNCRKWLFIQPHFDETGRFSWFSWSILQWINFLSLLRARTHTRTRTHTHSLSLFFSLEVYLSVKDSSNTWRNVSSSSNRRCSSSICCCSESFNASLNCSAAPSRESSLLSFTVAEFAALSADPAVSWYRTKLAWIALY